MNFEVTLALILECLQTCDTTNLVKYGSNAWNHVSVLMSYSGPNLKSTCMYIYILQGKSDRDLLLAPYMPLSMQVLELRASLRLRYGDCRISVALFMLSCPVLKRTFCSADNWARNFRRILLKKQCSCPLNIGQCFWLQLCFKF